MSTRPHSTPSTSAILTCVRICTPTSYCLVVPRYVTVCVDALLLQTSGYCSRQFPTFPAFSRRFAEGSCCACFCYQMYEGLPERMSKEITNLAPNSMKIKVVAPPESMCFVSEGCAFVSSNAELFSQVRRDMTNVGKPKHFQHFLSQGSTLSGLVDPSWHRFPLSKECGSRKRSMTRLGLELCTVSASKALAQRAANRLTLTSFLIWVLGLRCTLDPKS